MAEQLMDLETFERLYVDGDYELDEGRLIPVSHPMPIHGAVCANVTTELVSFVKPRKLGKVFANDTGFVLSPDTAHGPDVAFVSAEKLRDATLKKWLRLGPDIVVEVYSANDRPGQLQRQVGQFLDADSRLVWVLYPEERKAVIYKPDGTVRIETQALDGEDVLPGLSVTLDDIFD